jgi:hypothetical protein
MKRKEIAKATFNDALELCDEIQRMSKLVDDPIAYVEYDDDSDSITLNTVTLVEETLTDGSMAYSFVLS